MKVKVGGAPAWLIPKCSANATKLLVQSSVVTKVGTPGSASFPKFLGFGEEIVLKVSVVLFCFLSLSFDGVLARAKRGAHGTLARRDCCASSTTKKFQRTTWCCWSGQSVC
jgi:hypothetical protein